jgi:drug/metabolite transporter (DMT)-like permease
MQDAILKKAQTNFRSGLLLAILGTALFSLKSIFIKLAFAEGVDAPTLLALRMLIAAPLYLLIFFWVIRQAKRSKHARTMQAKDLWSILALGFMGYYLASFLDFAGLQHISAQLERLILFAYPVMVALLNWAIFSEKITKPVWFALVSTYLGVMFLYLYESNAAQGSVVLGTSLVALAALSFSIYVIFSKDYIQRLGSLFFTSVAMLSSTTFVFIHFLFGHQISDLDVSTPIWLYAFLLGIVSTLIPSFMVSEAIARIGGTKTSIAGSIGPVFTVLLAVIILGEDFGWSHLLGITLVVIGVLALAMQKS